jgi:Tfp pilus assembly protein PilF
MKTPRTLRAGRFSRFVPFVAVAVAAGAGCGSSEKKPDPKPTHTEVKEEKNIDVPADEEAITTIRASREFKLAAQHLKGENADVAKARAALERAAKADGEFALARYNLAVLLEQEGKVAEASRLYREAYDKDPSLDLAVENLGVLLESRGQFDAARELYEDAIAKNAEAVGPRLRLARMQYADGDFKNAARLARQALQFDAKSLDAYRLLARLYAERKKNQLARLIALRGQKLADGDAELVYALALVAINDKDVAGARILLREVIAKDENHIDARVTLAEMALKNRDWKTATPPASGAGEARAHEPAFAQRAGHRAQRAGALQRRQECLRGGAQS